MAEEGKRYQCGREGCGCEVTVNRLPDDYGTFGTMSFGEAPFGEGAEPKCPFCQSEMSEAS